MANNSLLVDERQSDLGNFIVGKLLPFRKKKQVKSQIQNYQVTTFVFISFTYFIPNIF